MTTGTQSHEGWQLEGDSAEAYERYLASQFSPWASQLVALAEVRPGDRVLDVACGTGIVARHAVRATGATGTVAGLDINEGMLRAARAASSNLAGAIEWRQGNATALPYDDGSFDVALCEQALQFFTDPAKALSEMRRVLAPGGRAAVSVCRPIRFSPAYVVMANALDRRVGHNAGDMMRSPFSTWTAAQLRELFAGAGFLDVHTRIEAGALRYPSCSEFLRREAASSPLSGSIGSLDGRVREALVSDLEAQLADRVDDEGVVCSVESYVVSARVHAPSRASATSSGSPASS